MLNFLDNDMASNDTELDRKIGKPKSNEAVEEAVFSNNGVVPQLYEIIIFTDGTSRASTVKAAATWMDSEGQRRKWAISKCRNRRSIVSIDGSIVSIDGGSYDLFESN